MSREVLSPPLQQMGPNRCYRVNLVHEDFGGNKTQQQATKEYVENDLYTQSDEDEDEQDFPIEELPDSTFKLECHVHSEFYGGIIGFKGNTKRRLESETQTEIIVPRQRNVGKQSNNLIIKGKSRSNILSAHRKIKAILISLRKRMPKTHFVGVDLHKTEIREKFIDFRTQILEKSYPGIDEHLFMPDNRLHLTLQTCVLLDETERTEAVKVLQNCSKYLEGITTPFDVKVTGLEIMNDDPSAVRVLYGTVDAPELQKFGDLCLAAFIKTDLSFKEFDRDNIKLHMTVMNSRYRKKIIENAPDTFDAREILKQFGSFNFGTTKCNEISLCVMGTGSLENVFYKKTSTLNF
ncbi:activating signal cointegrator 1 complex subunit 1 [Teleopsis dalmanni]|uniref:activating signal cointegrator 1 complex subunit 1 n=1 Tax=Teleopsis dalmanni TaxID=139649 RepID=UPI0018CD41FC|nr:activating signal cointegrator 1 complex subunit 1 [Teleopsis dalmanni]XP_037950606.1 activating signal cointegrator 1 complex subunit 1 [Teleopsis dalmanni]